MSLTGGRIVVCVGLALAGLLYAGNAHAGPLDLGFGVQGGYGESKDATSGSALVGGHVELRPVRFIGLVGAVDYKLDEEFTVQPDAGSDLTYSAHSVPVSLLGRLYFSILGFDPYVTAGAQWRYISYDFGDLESAYDDFAADDSESAFGWVLGGGVALNPWLDISPFSLFAEARYEFVDANRDLGSSDIQGMEEFDYNQWSVVGGITFSLN